MLRYYIIPLLLFLGTISVFGLSSRDNDENNLSSTSFPSQFIEIVLSNEYIDLATETGKSLLLPKYNMVMVNEPESVDSLVKITSQDINNLKEELALRKEMDDLSHKLGVNITESDYINLYREVSNWLGTRYRRGGMSRSAVDCSGFTNIIYNTVFNKKIPRVSTAIAKKVTETLPLDKLLPGDLVFFSTLGKKYINHVGVYLGEGRFVHASIKGGVKVSTLADGYYKRTLKKAGRILDMD